MPPDAPPAGDSALTILEMLVSTAMLSFIILGLTAVLIQTQKAFKTGIKQSTITDAGRTITDMIADDLRQMSDGENSNVINFYCDWALTNSVAQTNIQAVAPGQFLRTNQLDEVFILVRTNNIWTGVGYAVSNTAYGVGTLYRYLVSSNGPDPLTTNALFIGFSNGIVNQSFNGASNWHRIADGVVHFQVRAYDPYGNENAPETNDDMYQFGHPGATGYLYYSYPGPLGPFTAVPTVTDTLPSAVELELGILEPDTLSVIESLPSTAQTQWMVATAPSKEEIFRERITVPAVAR